MLKKKKSWTNQSQSNSTNALSSASLAPKISVNLQSRHPKCNVICIMFILVTVCHVIRHEKALLDSLHCWNAFNELHNFLWNWQTEISLFSLSDSSEMLVYGNPEGNNQNLEILKFVSFNCYTFLLIQHTSYQSLRFNKGLGLSMFCTVLKTGNTTEITKKCNVSMQKNTDKQVVKSNIKKLALIYCITPLLQTAG